IRRSKPMTAAIRGKGSKIRYVPVMDQTARLVADYLEHRHPHPGLGADTDPLFHGPNHSRLTRSGMAKILARHVRAIQAGVNLIYIRDLLGHADASTTEIYARADAETKRKAIENAYQTLTPDILPDWTSDTSLIGWLDSLAREHPPPGLCGRKHHRRSPHQQKHASRAHNPAVHLMPLMANST